MNTPITLCHVIISLPRKECYYRYGSFKQREGEKGQALYDHKYQFSLVSVMKIEFRKNPTFIHDDGRVEIKCEVNGEGHRIFMSLDEFMELLQDEIRALTHYLKRAQTAKP